MVLIMFVCGVTGCCPDNGLEMAGHVSQVKVTGGISCRGERGLNEAPANPYQEKNHMIPYQDTCIRFMKTAEPFSYKNRGKTEL
ncbi:MAG: hypothetical protein WC382_10605 [Methanoregulaceae archaeon]|jgi:hypothetical protein